MSTAFRDQRLKAGATRPTHDRGTAEPQDCRTAGLRDGRTSGLRVGGSAASILTGG
jgi:hypothetical protein